MLIVEFFLNFFLNFYLNYLFRNVIFYKKCVYNFHAHLVETEIFLFFRPLKLNFFVIMNDYVVLRYNSSFVILKFRDTKIYF